MTSARSRGLVLPMVLILLALITMLVAAQLRRGLQDERMAGSLRAQTVVDSALQTVLRWCEWRLVAAPFSTASVVAPVRGSGVTAAWRVAANWDPAAGRTFQFSGVDLPGVTGHACLIERADAELVPAISDTGAAIDPGDRGRWMKFRVTARVGRERGGFDQAQSELRLYLD